MPFLALMQALSLTMTPVVALDHQIDLTFLIVNDDQQKIITVNQGDFVFSPPSDFILRDNVRLRGWYQDEALTQFHDFDAPLFTSKVIYAAWDYLNPGVLARLHASEIGTRFESNTMTLSMPLYEPLKAQVRFQWQSASSLSGDFQSIGGATKSTFAPFRNGTFQYRLRYRVPLYNANGLIIDSITYYSEVVTLTIYGQQTNVGYLLFAGLSLLTSVIVFLRVKRKVYYEVGEGDAIIPGLFHIGEDISLQPKAKKKGHRFQGWYLDSNFQILFTGFRMPLKSIKLYAKFKKTKSNRKSN
jgi:uncharacterized repeat protein (TIGR02543 family)